MFSSEKIRWNEKQRQAAAKQRWRRIERQLQLHAAINKSSSSSGNGDIIKHPRVITFIYFYIYGCTKWRELRMYVRLLWLSAWKCFGLVSPSSESKTKHKQFLPYDENIRPKTSVRYYSCTFHRNGCVWRHLPFGSDLLLSAKSTTKEERLFHTNFIRSKLARSQISNSTKNKHDIRCERATECMHSFAPETFSCNTNKKLFSENWLKKALCIRNQRDARRIEKWFEQ